MKYILITALVILALGLIACKGSKATTSSLTTDDITSEVVEKMTPYLIFSKGGCYGTCPIYKMTISEDGLAVYEGERFTERLGKHVKQLDATTWKELKSQFNGIDFWSLPEKYEFRIPDLASSTITVLKGEQTKATQWKDQAPDEVKALGKAFEKIGNDPLGWKLVVGQELPDYMIADEIIVNLIKGTDEQTWIQNYRAYGATIKEKIAPNMNYWLITYNTEKIDPYSLLNKLNADKAAVIQAEFNKKVTSRN